MKDTKHIRQNFHSVTWVTPQGWDFGGAGGAQGVKKNFFTMVMWYINRWGWRAEQNASKIFILGSIW